MTHEEQVLRMTETMAKFIGHTGKKLPDDVPAKLEELRSKEDDPLTKVIYDTMFRNQEQAQKLDRPSCQDTGVLRFWVKCGTRFPLIVCIDAQDRNYFEEKKIKYERVKDERIRKISAQVGFIK